LKESLNVGHDGRADLAGLLAAGLVVHGTQLRVRRSAATAS
jgi:hypothetical protein